MSLKLSFRNKLLLFWLGSILVVLALVGTVYFYLHAARLTNTSLERIGDTFSSLNVEIKTRKDTLRRNAQSLSRRQANIDILSMVSSYQDITNYQPLVFDPEKLHLAHELTKNARALNLHYLAAYDINSALVSFYDNDSKTGELTGYQSYQDGKPVLMSTTGDENTFSEHPLPTSFTLLGALNHTHDELKLDFHNAHGGIVMETFAKITKTQVGGQESTAGALHASYLLDEELFKKVAAQKELQFSVLLPDGTHFGNLPPDLHNKNVLDAAVTSVIDSARPLFHQVISNGYVLGTIRLPLSGEKHAYLIFGEKQSELTSGLEPALLAAFLFIGTLLPAAMYFMNKTFTKPVEDLLAGVDNLRKGSYEKLTGFTGTDELSVLAKAFNTMSQSIQDREQDLFESEARFGALANYTPNKVHIKDLEGRYILINPKSETLFGVTNEEAKGKTSADIFSPEMVAAYQAHDRAVLDIQKPVEAEEIFLLPDGMHTFLTVKFPIFGVDGDMVAMGSVGFEITERKRAEEELKAHRTHLEELVHERTAEVEEKAKKLEKALQIEKEYNILQQKFVSMVSHEFRTPLAIIDGAAQRMMRHKDSLKADEVELRVSKIRAAISRMVDQIDTTLFASRLDEGQIEFHLQNCDVHKLLKDVCERQSEISPDYNIQIDASALPNKIRADPKLLDQVLTNLLSNAVKYAQGSPLILVKGWQEGHHAFISVTDQGVGIPASDLPHMFKRFFRAKTAFGISGTGIGLSVVNEIVKLHSGTIKIDSQEGDGTTFTVSLPIGFQP